MAYDKDSYPQKWVTVQNSEVIGFVMNYSPQSIVTAPSGAFIYQVDPASDIEVGWAHSFDDEKQKDVWTKP